MRNPILERLNGTVARGFRRRGLLVSAALAVAACAGEATPHPPVAAVPEIPGSFEFPLVHPRESTPDGRRTLRLDREKGTLEITYTDRPAAARTAVVKVGMQPVSVRAASDREAWVVDPIADSISIVDLDAATVIATLQTAPQPSDVMFSGSPSLAYVTVARGRALLVFDPLAPAQPPTRIALQFPPRHAEGDDI